MHRQIRIRMLFALVLAGVLGAVGLGFTVSPRIDASASTAPATAPMLDEVAILDTVTVTATVPPTVLPLVQVTAEAAPLDMESEWVASDASTGTALPTGLPHVRLDMPYYAFGQMHARTIKE